MGGQIPIFGIVEGISEVRFGGCSEEIRGFEISSLYINQMTLMHLQRARNNEKDEQESNLNELLMSVERKY